MNAGKLFTDNKDQWLTDDLLQQVTKNPVLARRLTDPSFMQALTEFQTNPTAAQKKYAKNPEMRQFMQEFCAIMGDHLSNMPAGNSAPSSAQPTPATHSSRAGDILIHEAGSAADIIDADEAKMQAILAEPKTRSILQDVRIQRLL